MAAMMQPEKEKPGLLARYAPIVHWLPHYNNAWLSGDIIACLSAAKAGSSEAIALVAVITLLAGFLYIILSVLRMGWGGQKHRA
jgi:MFS superfamily sulfate permease-like transporter